MTSQEQTIPCPLCQTAIPFNAKQLLEGAQIKCPNTACDASIGLAQDSKPQVLEAMEKFRALKDKKD